VVRWRAVGHGEGGCKGRIGRGDHKVEDMILVIGAALIVNWDFLYFRVSGNLLLAYAIITQAARQ